MKIAVIGRGKLGSCVVLEAEERGHETVPFTDADLVIEATAPESAVANIEKAVLAGKPILVATTGWYTQIDKVRLFVERHNGFCLYAPNFSLLMQHLIRLLPEFYLEGFQYQIHETHHVTKKDAPSGTALAISEALHGTAIESHRVDKVVGVHQVVIENGLERLTLTHEGLDRRLFARGIIDLLPQVIGKKGFWNLQEFLCSSPL